MEFFVQASSEAASPASPASVLDREVVSLRREATYATLPVLPPYPIPIP